MSFASLRSSIALTLVALTQIAGTVIAKPATPPAGGTLAASLAPAASPTTPAASPTTPPSSPSRDQIREADLVAPKVTPSAKYTVRGQVTALPLKDKPSTELMVQHEAIDAFANKDGKVVGMSAMTMEFPPQKGVDVRDLQIGDKVEIEFAVWWSQSPPWLATAIRKLPTDTKLEFRRADPSKAVAKPEAKSDSKPEATSDSKPDPASNGKLSAAKPSPVDVIAAAISDKSAAAILKAAVAKAAPGSTVTSIERDDEFPDDINAYFIDATGAPDEAGGPGVTHHLLVTDRGTLLIHTRSSAGLPVPAELLALIQRAHPQAKTTSVQLAVSYDFIVQFKASGRNYVAILSASGDFDIQEGEEDMTPEPAAPNAGPAPSGTPGQGPAPSTPPASEPKK